MPLEVRVERDGKDISTSFEPWTDRMLFCWFTASLYESEPKKLDESIGRSYDDLRKFLVNEEEYDRHVDWSVYFFMGGPYMDPWGAALKKGGQILNEDWRFFIQEESDGPERIVEFKSGDKLRAWRSHER